MSIIFRDDLGYIAVNVDEYGIQFADGMAYFSGLDGKEYRVPLENMVGVSHESVNA